MGATTVKLSRSARESGAIYAAALTQACQLAAAQATGKASGRVIDPLKVLTDTDDYPQVTKDVDQAEFLVGWFHGVSDALGIQIETLWETIAPSPPIPPRPTKAKPKAKAKAAPKAKPSRAAKAKATKATKDNRTQVTFDQLVTLCEAGRQPAHLLVVVSGSVQAALALSLGTSHGITIDVLDQKAAA